MADVLIQVGDRHGDYQFLERIGEGAFSEVWRALHVPSHEERAVKVQPSSAPAPSALSHRGIVRVIESVTRDDLRLTAMDLIRGGNLRQAMVQRGTLPLDESLEIARQVLDALDHAHGRGIMHLDLKPENILLDDRKVWICDFGSARDAQPPPALERSLDSDRPEDRQIVGTAAYMAPEQRMGVGRATGKSDLYSFGVILYEMLTGQLPLGAFRWPSEIYPDVAPHIDQVIRRCLRPNPDRRFESAAEIQSALDEAAEAPGAESSALTLREIDEIRSLRELVDYATASQTGWREARRALFNGTLQEWLRDTRHFSLAREIESLRTLTDKDEAMERFLEETGYHDPPTLDIDLAEDLLDLGEIQRGTKRRATLRIIKRGRGYLKGEVTGEGAHVDASPARFTLGAVDRPLSEVTAEVIVTGEGEPGTREEGLTIGARTLRLRYRVHPRPVELSIADEASIVAVGGHARPAVMELRNVGDEEARVSASANVKWVRVRAPDTLGPGKRARIRLEIDPAAIRTEELVVDPRLEAPMAKAIVTFRAGDAESQVRLTYLQIRRFSLWLFLGGLVLGAVPVAGELLFLVSLAELGLHFMGTAEESMTEEVRRANRFRESFSMVLALIPGILLHVLWVL